MPFSGGDEGDRTPYLLNAIQALSQVSYTPMTYSLFAGVRFCAARTPKWATPPWPIHFSPDTAPCLKCLYILAEKGAVVKIFQKLFFDFPHVEISGEFLQIPENHGMIIVIVLTAMTQGECLS